MAGGESSRTPGRVPAGPSRGASLLLPLLVLSLLLEILLLFVRFPTPSCEFLNLTPNPLVIFRAAHRLSHSALRAALRSLRLR